PAWRWPTRRCGACAADAGAQRILRTMYAQFFGLSQEPFSIAPDPRFLFMSERHREALAHLLYGVRGGGGFVLLTGEIGAGKTTVCRCFLEQIPKRCNVAYIFNPKLTVEELLKSICDEFRVPFVHEGAGAPTVKDYLDPLNEFLLKTHAVGQNNVLIIDEAQNLTPKQMKTLITRAGPGTKIVCLGNLAQIDTPYLTEGSSGLTFAVDRFKGWPHSGHVMLARGERSRLADYASEVL
ncbi:AAA family ATPase, partial [Salmonella enterica]|uniref:ExeA family protein n=1 Tax=Salmonella enterica TaxID=28901 RepID=UPI003FA6F441